MNKPAGRLIIVLVNNRHFQARCQIPAFHIIGSGVKRTDCSNHRYFGVFFNHGIVNHGKPFLENIGYQILVADANVFQVKRFGMTGGCAYFSPFCGFVAIRPFNQVEHFLNVFVHIAQRNPSLLAVSAGGRVLARNTRSQHRKRFGANILTKLKIFEISQSGRLMVIPDISLRNACFQRPHCIVPVVNILNAVAVGNTTPRKTNKPRM